MPIKKPTTTGGKGTAVGKCDCKTLLKFPLLLSYMQDDKYEDGSSRERSKLSIFIEQGHVKAALNDPGERRSAYCTADTLQGVLELLEDGLKTEAVEWRGWNHNTKKKKD